MSVDKSVFSSIHAKRHILITLLFLISIAGASALNARMSLPVTVAPLTNGALTPNTTYAYNFVFSTSTACTPLLNVSANITTDSRGIGSAQLNISTLVTTPSYICEYVNGAYRTTHNVFSSTFESKTSDQEILSFGYNHTGSLDTYFIRNATIPLCSGSELLTYNGTFSCVTPGGAGTVTNITPGAFMGFAPIASNGNVSLNITAVAQNIGNFSAENSSIWNNASNQQTQLATLFTWNTTIQNRITSIGNWTADKNGLNNLSLTQITTNIGNWSADKSTYNTTVQLSNVFCFANGTNCLSGLTLAQISANLGNFTAENSSIWNNASNQQTQLATLFTWNTTIQNRITSIGNWTADKNGLNNLSLTQITTNIGNWSADKTGLNNLSLAQIMANIGNWSANASSYTTTATGDTRWLRNSTIPTCSGTDKLTSSGNGELNCTPDDAGLQNGSDVNFVNANVTGALCLGAEGVGLLPCRTFWGDQENQRRYMTVQMDPFLVCGAETGEYGHWGWLSTLGGTGADVTCVASPDETALGTISLGSGTLTASNATLTTDTTANAGLWVNGSTGITGWFSRVRVDATSTGTQGYTLLIGFGDITTGSPPTDGVYFMYNGTQTGGSGNWSIVTSSNSARTTQDTSISVAANTWYDLECQIYNATQATCYVNGVEAGTVSTNIPSGSARAFWPGRITIGKNVGTTERRLYIDYYGVYRVFNSPRW